MFRMVGVAVLALAGSAIPGTAPATEFSFGVWGDMPYARSNDGPKIPALVADMNGSDIAFSIFDGDIKDGGSPCTDDIYTQAIALFDSLAKPLIYVPGDNEWTDCHRLNNGGYDNLERLDHLRDVMFADGDSFGATTIPLEHQGAPYVENTRFVHGGVVFVGLDMPGSNNNRVHDDDCTDGSARTTAQCDADNAEYAARDAANIAWMREGFAAAKAGKAVGLVLVVQANPRFDVPETDDVNEREEAGADGYTAFLDALAAESQEFAGQVLFVHGDTHTFRVDKPLVADGVMLANVTRLETFGSPNVHWVKVTVDPTARGLFTILPMIVPGN